MCERQETLSIYILSSALINRHWDLRRAINYRIPKPTGTVIVIVSVTCARTVSDILRKYVHNTSCATDGLKNEKHFAVIHARAWNARELIIVCRFGVIILRAAINANIKDGQNASRVSKMPRIQLSYSRRHLSLYLPNCTDNPTVKR